MDHSQFDAARSSADAEGQSLIDSFAKGSISRRTFVTRGSMLGLSAAVMGSVIAACGSSSSGSTTTAAGATTTAAPGTTAAPATTMAGGSIKEGGTLRVAAQRPGSPLSPYTMDNLGSYTLVTQSFEYLCGKGEGADLAPMLAESWTPNADGSEWTFKLRQGVKWHDGTDFTAKDVVASIDHLAAANLSAYIKPGAATASDDYTVVVKLGTDAEPNKKDGQFCYSLSLYNPQSLMTPAAWYTEADNEGKGTTLDSKPNGTGPFKLTKYDVASGATFEANADWWGGKPHLDGVEWIFSDDITTQISGLQGGAADALVGFSVLDGDALLSDPNLTITSIKGAAHRQLWMNVRDENEFKDINVRQAVALAISRQEKIDNILKGKGQIGNDHPIASVYPFFDAAQAQREQDLEAAKAALAKSKTPTGFKTTMYVPKLLEIPTLAEAIQSDLKQIGIEADLKVESTDTFYSEWCKVYDSTNAPAGCDGGQNFGIVDYGNRGVPDVYLVKAYATGEWNSAHYNSTEFNDAVTKYQAALTLDDRKGPISDIQRIANNDVPYAIVYFYDSLTAWSNKVTGITGTGLGHYYLGAAGFTA